MANVGSAERAWLRVWKFKGYTDLFAISNMGFGVTINSTGVEMIKLVALIKSAFSQNEAGVSISNENNLMKNEIHANIELNNKKTVILNQTNETTVVFPHSNSEQSSNDFYKEESTVLASLFKYKKMYGTDQGWIDDEHNFETFWNDKIENEGRMYAFEIAERLRDKGLIGWVAADNTIYGTVITEDGLLQLNKAHV